MTQQHPPPAGVDPEAISHVSRLGPVVRHRSAQPVGEQQLHLPAQFLLLLGLHQAGEGGILGQPGEQFAHRPIDGFEATQTVEGRTLDRGALTGCHTRFL